MKNSFSKEDKMFQEMLMRNAANQDLYGGMVGNELNQDIVEDQIGSRKVLSSIGTIVKTGPDGMPYVIRERVGKILDCGHMVYSLEGFGGECYNGHSMCHNCGLYICEWCGVKICDLCSIVYQDGLRICGYHRLRMLKRFLIG